MTSRSFKFKHLLAAIFVLFFMFGIYALSSNPRKASEGNFRRALNEAVARPVSVSVEELPLKLYGQIPGGFKAEEGDIVLRVRSRSSSRQSELAGRLMHDLVEAELAESISEGTVVRNGWLPLSYDLYRIGAKQARKLDMEHLADNGTWVRRFSVGTVEVERILRWTEPAQGSGIWLCRVDYTLKVGGAPRWAKSVLEGVVDEEPASMRLELTNKGWMPR